MRQPVHTIVNAPPVVADGAAAPPLRNPAPPLRNPAPPLPEPAEHPVTALSVTVLRRGIAVEISGRLDARTAPVARAVLHSTIEDGAGDLVLHLGGLELWDASGLGVVVGAHRRAQHAGRRLVLTDVRLRQLRQLRATRLLAVLTVEPATG